MSHFHAVVWLDHREARVFHVAPGDVEKTTVHGHKAHLHHKASGVAGSGREPADIVFFEEIAAALAGAQEILVVGPGAAKLEFIRHATRNLHDLHPRIIGVETVDHPTDRQTVAFARQYFQAKDRMRPLLAQAG